MRSVLLVDDDPVQLRVREAILRGAGLTTHIATTADGALALLRSGDVGAGVGAIVTDHIMPGASGSRFVGALRELRPDLPIIVVSGLPLAELEDEYRGMAGISCRSKPCAPDELIALIRSSMQT